jgi:glycosyltransferase involved in cell wall biosynthesis
MVTVPSVSEFTRNTKRNFLAPGRGALEIPVRSATSSLEMNTDVAVIVPVYNRLSLLGYTLDAILNQTLPPREVIVVDDGSQEDVESFVSAFHRDNLRSIRTPNRGVNAARNTGAAAAQSRWLAFCDSDDLWLPEKLERQIELLRLAADCQYCLVDYQPFNENGLQEPSHLSYASPAFWEGPRRDFGAAGVVLDRDMFLTFLHFQPAITSTVLLSHEQFDKVGGWNEAMSLNPAQDFEFHLLCASHPPVAIVPQVLMHYRVHDLSWSADGLRQDFAGVEILESMLARHPLAKRHESRFRQEIESRTIECADRAFYEGRFAFFQQLLRRVPWNRRPPRLAARYLLTLLPAPLFRGIHQGVRRMKGTEDTGKPPFAGSSPQ